jgi:hypothetical protein
MQEATQNPFEASASLLDVLERKAFYKDRFLNQIKALYPDISSADARLAPTVYLNGLLSRLPDVLRAIAVKYACKRIVNSRNECPSPAEVRQFIAESALEAGGFTIQSLYEQAKAFLVRPPQLQATADRWFERVIYTAVRRVSRERFALTPLDQWLYTVTEVMLNDTIKLVTYQVESREAGDAVRTKRDFTGLMKNAR